MNFRPLRKGASSETCAAVVGGLGQLPSNTSPEPGADHEHACRDKPKPCPLRLFHGRRTVGSSLHQRSRCRNQWWKRGRGQAWCPRILDGRGRTVPAPRSHGFGLAGRSADRLVARTFSRLARASRSWSSQFADNRRSCTPAVSDPEEPFCAFSSDILRQQQRVHQVPRRLTLLCNSGLRHSFKIYSNRAAYRKYHTYQILNHTQRDGAARSR